MKRLLLVAVLGAVATLFNPAAGFAQTFSASGPGGAIPDGSGSSTPGVPLISVATIVGSGPITDVTVDFSGLAHTFTGDLTITLTHPDTVTTLDIQLRPGRGSASTFGFSSDYLAGNTYSFSDAGADLYAAAPASPIASGIYRASSNPNPPATNALPYVYTPTSFASTFGGLDAGGNWTLTITDWAGGDTGTLDGWTVNVTVSTVPEPTTLALGGLALCGSVLVARRRRLKDKQVA